RHQKVLNSKASYSIIFDCDCYTRVCYEKDTKFINAPLDTSQLQRYGNVVFSGCQLPHPLMYKIIVR
ncbi:unnamed protein product, partial [Brassica napus]